MDDQRVIHLLEEIRDLQKLHVENYKEALKNQQEAIDIQKRMARRQKIILIVAGLLLVGVMIVASWPSHTR